MKRALLVLFVLILSNLISEQLRNIWEHGYNWNISIIDSLDIELNNLRLWDKYNEDELFISGYEAAIDTILTPYSYFLWGVKVNSELLKNNLLYILITDSLETEKLRMKVIIEDDKERIDLGPTFYRQNIISGIYNCYLVTDLYYSKNRFSGLWISLKIL